MKIEKRRLIDLDFRIAQQLSEAFENVYEWEDKTLLGITYALKRKANYVL